jgi:hypothetical protein
MTDRLHVCKLIEDLPIPHVPSVVRECFRCGKPVWVDRKKILDDIPKICWHCVKLVDENFEENLRDAIEIGDSSIKH